MKIIVFFGCFPRRRSCSTNGIWVGRWRFTKNIWRKHEALYLYQLGRWTLLYQIVFFLGPTPNTIIYEIWKDLFFSFPQRSSESVPGRQFFWLHVYKLWKYNIRCFSSPCWANFNHGPLCHTRQWFWAPMSTYIILHIYIYIQVQNFWATSGSRDTLPGRWIGRKNHNGQHQHPWFLLQFRWVLQILHLFFMNYSSKTPAHPSTQLDPGLWARITLPLPGPSGGERRSPRLLP